jgi:hypothetical protein
VDFQHAFGTAPGWGIAARQSGAHQAAMVAGGHLDG